MKTQKLQGGLAAVLLVLNILVPVAGAQTQGTSNGGQLPAQVPVQGQQVPNAPAPAAATFPVTSPPNFTLPVDLRPTTHDYSQPKSFWKNPIAPYTATNVPPPRFTNSARLDDLFRNGKIYLGLNDAILLALQNNYDIAIARYNLDIADTDIMRTKAGQPTQGVNSGLVTGTLGGSTSPVFSSAPSSSSSSSSTTGTTAAASPNIQTNAAVGGGPGGTSTGAGGAGAGAAGLVLSTLGAGPATEPLDPVFTSQMELRRANVPETSSFLTGSFKLNNNTNLYNYTYTQGFLGGELLQVTFDNTRQTSNANSSFGNFYSPAINTNFNAQLTQHLLQGFGWAVNGRYIAIAKNDRRISDSAFRSQLLYTVDQIENIYWGLVGVYQDEQAKEAALKQSTQLLADDKKELEIGTLAPLDVVYANSQVASDSQALIAAKTKLEYQQLLMKQAIARNLDDPILAAAPIIPTDRVSLLQTPEEQKPVEDLVQEAYANSPSIEQAALNIKNDEITLKSVKNALLPSLDAYGFYGAQAIGGTKNPLIKCGKNQLGIDPCEGTPGLEIPYSTTLNNLVNSSYSNKGVGLSLNIPIRNRTAQAQQARAQLEYRQAQMRLHQLYVQVRMQVTNQLYALENDRAQVQSAEASQNYAVQSLDAEQKKYHLGASTTANVLLQTRNLETAQDNLISAQTTYATDRAALSQLVADTLDKYGISITDAATGNISQAPNVPGLEAPKAQPTPEPLHPEQQNQPAPPSGTTPPSNAIPPTAPNGPTGR